MKKFILNALLDTLFFIIFFLIVTPIGLVLRLFGVDFMQRKISPDSVSYWHKLK